MDTGNGEVDQRYYGYYNRPSADRVNSNIGYDTVLACLHAKNSAHATRPRKCG